MASQTQVRSKQQVGSIRRKKSRVEFLLKIAEDPRVMNASNPTDRIVLENLVIHAPIKRDDLVEITGIARTTLYDSLTRLELLGLVNKFTRKTKSGPGRATVLFESVFNTS